MTSSVLGRLWARYWQTRTALTALPEGPRKRTMHKQANQLRDRLVVNYSPLVKYVAGRISSRTSSASDMEDLISWGIFGLLDAIETFDPGREVKFESYAISKIRWAILDELRRTDWVPRRVRARAQEAEHATSKLAQKLGRMPTEREVSEELNLGLEEYRRFRRLYSRAQMTSLEARAEAETPGAQAFVSDKTSEDPQQVANAGALRGQLVKAIENLEEREQLVATFYFYEGLTLKEIGKALNLTEGRISQILRQALIKLRKVLTEDAVALDGL